MTPVNEYLALLYCTLILLALGLIFHLVKWSVKKRYTAKLERLYKVAQRHVGYEVSTVNSPFTPYKMYYIKNGCEIFFVFGKINQFDVDVEDYLKSA